MNPTSSEKSFFKLPKSYQNLWKGACDRYKMLHQERKSFFRGKVRKRKKEKRKETPKERKKNRKKKERKKNDKKR